MKTQDQESRTKQMQGLFKDDKGHTQEGLREKLSSSIAGVWE
jgi:hypothetical protein